MCLLARRAVMMMTMMTMMTKMTKMTMMALIMIFYSFASKLLIQLTSIWMYYQFQNVNDQLH